MAAYDVDDCRRLIENTFHKAAPDLNVNAPLVAGLIELLAEEHAYTLKLFAVRERYVRVGDVLDWLDGDLAAQTILPLGDPPLYGGIALRALEADFLGQIMAGEMSSTGRDTDYIGPGPEGLR